MKGNTFWVILCIILGVIGAVFFGPSLAGRLGWPTWLVYIIVFLDVAFVLYAPLQLRDNYAALKLHQMGYRTSLLGLLLSTLIFVVVPFIVLLWLMSKL